MKKIVFAILLSMFTLSSFAQKDSLYVDGMKWVTGYYQFQSKDSVMRVYTVYYTYIIKGDTLINNINYKKMVHLYRNSKMTNEKYYRTYLCRYDNGKYLFYMPDEKEFWDEDEFIGDDYVFFDENLVPGDSVIGSVSLKIGSIGDTVFNDSPNEVRKFWKMQPYPTASSRYREALNYVMWVDGIGSLSQPMPYIIGEVDCACYQMLLYCINPAGDTIYRNQKYIDLVEPYFKTDIPVLKSSDVCFSQRDDECVVTLPYASAWSATLYNSSGVTVASRSGEGDEIILPATSKGTNILVLNIDGCVVKKKVFIK